MQSKRVQHFVHEYYGFVSTLFYKIPLFFRLPAKIVECTTVQKSLLNIVQNWTKNPNQTTFGVIRTIKDLKEVEKALQSKDFQSLKHLTEKFVPIQINMCNGGTLDEGSRIFYPLNEKNDGKFVQNVERVDFHKNADIGIVTASTYSQRRGMSSGLGLVSVDSLEKFKTDNLSVVAIEKQLNGKYYLAKFKILYQ